jgi:LysM repeat protein
VASDSCALLDDEVASFVLGDVTAEVRSEIVSHLESCAPCRREVGELAVVVDSISATTSPVKPSEGFVERVLGAYLTELGEQSQEPPKPVAVVIRRRRTLAVLTAAASLLAVTAAAFGSWLLVALAILTAVMDAAYLVLVTNVTHSRARAEMDGAFGAHSTGYREHEETCWRELVPDSLAPTACHEVPTPPVVRVDNAAIIGFVFSYFLGWVLTPVVLLVRLARRNRDDASLSPALGYIVALQRRGRSQSLRLLLAGATTVATVGGTTATMPVSPGVASASTSGVTYTVHRGDTLSGIARRFVLSTASLARLNKISNPNLVLPGEVLRLGTDQLAADRTAPGGELYTVQPGDTLDAIASRFATSVSAIADLNDIHDPNLIFAGQTLRLPPPSSNEAVPAGEAKGQSGEGAKRT